MAIEVLQLFFSREVSMGRKYCKASRFGRSDERTSEGPEVWEVMDGRKFDDEDAGTKETCKGKKAVDLLQFSFPATSFYVSRMSLFGHKRRRSHLFRCRKSVPLSQD